MEEKTLAEIILERIEVLQDIQKSDGGSTGVKREDILREIEETIEEFKPVTPNLCNERRTLINK